MPRKPGLPAKYAKHGFKKGWRMWNAAKAKAKRSRTSGTKKRTTTRKRRTITSSPQKTGAIMAQRRKTTKAPARRRVIYRSAAPARRRRMGRRAPKLLTQQTMRIIIDGTLIGGGAIGSTVLVNKIPVVKDLNHWFKAAIQTGIGLTAITVLKDKYIKRLSMGMVVGGALSVTMPLLPEGMKVFGRRPFSPSELRELQTVGRPKSIPRPTMGRPVSVSTAQSDAPVMGRTSNRNSRFR